MIKVKRAYEPPEAGDGIRFLVDRLWPRGKKKEELILDAWLKDVSPSAELRRWAEHDPAKWEEFKRRYFAELDEKPEKWKPILEASRVGTVTLVYSARNKEYNNAVALKTYLGSKLK